jgi:hypothetical protein
MQRSCHGRARSPSQSGALTATSGAGAGRRPGRRRRRSARRDRDLTYKADVGGSTPSAPTLVRGGFLGLHSPAANNGKPTDRRESQYGADSWQVTSASEQAPGGSPSRGLRTPSRASASRSTGRSENPTRGPAPRPPTSSCRRSTSTTAWPSTRRPSTSSFRTLLTDDGYVFTRAETPDGSKPWHPDGANSDTFIGERVPLRHKPSDYVRERVLVWCDPDERSIPPLAERYGDRFLWASDFPPRRPHPRLHPRPGRDGHRVPRAVAGGRSWVTRCGRCSTSRTRPGRRPRLTATDPRPSSLRTPHRTVRCSPWHRLTEEEDE